MPVTNGPFGRDFDDIAKAYQKIHQKTLDDAKPSENKTEDTKPVKERLDEKLSRKEIKDFWKKKKDKKKNEETTTEGYKDPRVEANKKVWADYKKREAEKDAQMVGNIRKAFADKKEKDVKEQREPDSDRDEEERKHRKYGKKRENPHPNYDTTKERDMDLKDETINEISRGTLASYVKKAHVSGLKAAASGEEAFQKMGSVKYDYKKQREKLHQANETGEKREQGINRAASRLAREETVNEVSFDKLERYTKGAQNYLKTYGKEAPKTDLGVYGDSKEEQDQGAAYEKNIDRGRANRKKGMMTAYLKTKARARVQGSYGEETLQHIQDLKAVAHHGNDLSKQERQDLLDEAELLEGGMKRWLMDMEWHVEELRRQHKGDIPKMKADFLKKYPNQDRVFNNAARGSNDDEQRWRAETRREETTNEAAWPNYDEKKIGGGTLRSTTIPKEKVAEYGKDVIKKGVAAGKFLRDLQKKKYDELKKKQQLEYEIDNYDD